MTTTIEAAADVRERAIADYMAKAAAMGLSAKRRALAEAIATPPAGWKRPEQHVGVGIAWEREMPFPDHMREWPGLSGGKPYANWGPTYTQRVSVSIVSLTSVPFVRVHHCPWTETRTREVTLAKALAVLADPASELA